MGPEERAGLLEARIRDTLSISASGGQARFYGFLDEHRAREAEQAARGGPGNWMLWGGYPGAERVMFGAFPDFLKPEGGKFPIEAVTAVWRGKDRLTHRDFLGALLSAGVERSALGDILPGEGRCVLFCRKEIAGFLCSQVTRVGRMGVRLSPGAEEPYPAAHLSAPFSAVIASARLDCAVAAAAGTSRAKAAKMIRGRLVERNHEPAGSPDDPVEEGDILSIRGKGRFAVDRLGPVTKKGRIALAGRKYIG